MKKMLDFWIDEKELSEYSDYTIEERRYNQIRIILRKSDRYRFKAGQIVNCEELNTSGTLSSLDHRTGEAKLKQPNGIEIAINILKVTLTLLPYIQKLIFLIKQLFTKQEA